jgi:Lipocalin-like domain
MGEGVKLACFALLLVLFPALGYAAENELIGAWTLKSFVREVSGTGERYNQLGEHPKGLLIYSKDGRMSVIITAENRVAPRGDTPTDEERIKLHQTMIAYAGTYQVEDGKVIHHIDIAWNEARLGSDQVRYYTVDGAVLTLKTPTIKSPVDGREGVGVLVWEKVPPP